MQDPESSEQQELVAVCSSEVLGKGPTWDQIHAGDYSNFPWARYRGEIPAATVVPLLWEPIIGNKRVLVAYSNGHVRSVDAADLKELLKRLGQ